MTQQAASGTAKVLVCISVDWFALSHFQPLFEELNEIGADVVVVTQATGRRRELEGLGLRVIDFDYARGAMKPHDEVATARRLAKIIRAEQPAAVHLIAMKPIVLGCLALRFNRAPAVVLHMTGLGHLAIARSTSARLARRAALYLMAGQMRRSASRLLVENPDDLAFLEAGGVAPGNRVTVLGGAGIDPGAFPYCPRPGNINYSRDTPMIAASVGRMIHSKGLDVLIDAHAILRRQAREIPLEIELHGASDDGNPQGLSAQTLRAWDALPGVSWHGHSDDVAAVWQGVDIAVLPARSREGMPRALLEAAACGKTLIVSDVPGCRHFVRDGIEGLVVPPEDADALAVALGRLADDGELRERMGRAARRRVLDGFTQDDVRTAYRDVYRRVL